MRTVLWMCDLIGQSGVQNQAAAQRTKVLWEIPGRSVWGLVAIWNAKAMADVSGRFVYHKTARRL